VSYLQDLERERIEAVMPRAIRLRELGLSYPSIAALMGEDYGLFYAWQAWQGRLTAAGMPKARPRGRHAKAQA